eukprot:scaffold30454_cov34-Prasinocladus_malaysianus.AAC.1
MAAVAVTKVGPIDLCMSDLYCFTNKQDTISKRLILVEDEMTNNAMTQVSFIADTGILLAIAMLFHSRDGCCGSRCNSGGQGCQGCRGDHGKHDGKPCPASWLILSRSLSQIQCAMCFDYAR